MMRRSGLVFLLLAAAMAPAAIAQCPTEPTFQNFTGGGTVACPCFVPNEQAGAVFDVPSSHYPIEILKVGIGYGSAQGGQPAVLESAIHIYGAGLPDPGTPVFTLAGPQLADGAINEFDLELIPGPVINSGPFSVTLEFMNNNVGDSFAPTAVHDGNGCQLGKNLIRTDTGAWFDACLLGITGDWVFTVTYRQVNCMPPDLSGGVPTGAAGSTPLTIEKFGTSQLLFNWGASCSPNDTDYAIYEGTIGTYPSHGFKLCSTGGATGAVVFPGSGSKYYLIVPANATGEGSYGQTSSGVERAVGNPACMVQQAGACVP